MPLIAYDARGSIFAVLHELYWTAPDGSVHAVDLEAAEGGRLRDLWEVSRASGSAYWPEHLGDRFTEFRVERESGRAVRLIHRGSGHVRHRGLIEDALAAIEETQWGPLLAARRRILGDAGHPLRLGHDGRTWAEPERDAPPPPLLIHRLQADALLDAGDADAAGDLYEVPALLERDEQAAAEHEGDDEQDHPTEDLQAVDVFTHG